MQANEQQGEGVKMQGEKPFLSFNEAFIKPLPHTLIAILFISI